MKKAVTAAAIAALCVGKSHAQVPNSLFVMGGGYYESRGSYGIGNLGLGYQFDKHWTAGLIGGYSKVQSKLSWKQFGAFARYSSYFSNSQNFFWFAQSQASYITTYEIDPNSSYKNSQNGIGFSAVGGLGIHFGKGYAANLTPIGIGYNIGFSDNVPNSIFRENLVLSVNFRPEITISKNISWKKRKSAPAKTEIEE